VIGVVTGLTITLIAKVILYWIWPVILRLYLAHPVAIIPGLAAGFAIAGLLMQYFTPDPDEHSTEEIIRSYHERQGRIEMRSFVPKLLAAIATVGFGGSAALEGPSIYGGGAIGSWLWTRWKRMSRDPRKRRIMLISGAAAGMAAVFRAPLTGIVFALEMPYKDDLAHEALLPSLIASVVSYITLAFFLGAQPVFAFTVAATAFKGIDLLWPAILGVLCGLAAMVFAITFRRARAFMVNVPIPHWLKMMLGGILTGVCGVAYAVSGEASVSGDQHLHEAVRVADLWKVPVRDAMQTQVISTRASSTLREFVDHASAHHLHAAYPVFEGSQPAGVIAMRSLSDVPSPEWQNKSVATLTQRDVTRVSPECNLTEAVRLMIAGKEQHMLLVTSKSGKLEGILTHMDVLSALKLETNNGSSSEHHKPH
jgi:predicted transcriptional regulator